MPKFRSTLTATEACTYLGIRWGQWLTQMNAFHNKARKGASWMPTPIEGSKFSIKATFALDDILRLVNTFKVHGPIGTLPADVRRPHPPIHPVPEGDTRTLLVQYLDVFNAIKDPDRRQNVWVQLLQYDIAAKYAASTRAISFTQFLKTAMYRRFLNQLRGEARAHARASIVEHDGDLPDAIDSRQDPEIATEALRFNADINALPPKLRNPILGRLLDGDDDGLHKILKRAFPAVTVRRPIEQRLAHWRGTQRPSAPMDLVDPPEKVAKDPPEEEVVDLPPTIEQWLRNTPIEAIDQAIEDVTYLPSLATRTKKAIRTFLEGSPSPSSSSRPRPS